MQEVADGLGWSRAKVSRVETAQIRPHHGDVADLLDLYGVSSPERDALVTLAREIRRRGWWTAYLDVFSGSYVALEDEASCIRTWHPQLIHGLLQTADYARAVIRAGRVGIDDSEVDRRVAARMVRQALLTRDGAPGLHMILDEAVIRRWVGGRDVMKAQLDALAYHAGRPNITIQITPYAIGEHPGLDGRFTLLSYPDPADPDIAYIEGTMGDVYIESAEEVGAHKLRFERISALAMSPEDSVKLITKVAQE
ncbi:transcriptional regulator [Sphaerisporangium melleum]|uniref:Transcriptional regulator n=1 Tax=Sphaerisporangium melleum TaxID=321316 RepID=A0A917QXC6_9ACTN|nr:transcriptional regulator [Sphaerisporangium melleum]GII68208.1 transcriptional regulator [Sphaerisporangium melleum]